MLVQPTGTVTLLFTDVEGSTQLLGRLGTARYSELLELHRQLLREAFERYDGFEVGTEGDSFFVAFQRAEAAVAAAAEAQQALAGAAWPEGEPVRVRMGMHTGEPAASGGNYVGMDVHRAARIMSAGHGGQVLVSETTAALLDGVALRDLGPHRLKDLLGPIRLFQLEVEGLPSEFPRLRSLQRTKLPTAAWPLLGRERELEELRTLVADGARLVTLTGPGGSGKTRLALQAAAELSDDFVDGAFFVALAPLRDTGAVHATVAEALGLGADDDVAAWLAARRTLLVLDNLEHLVGVATAVAGLLVGETAVLATSRAPLHLSAERELPVEPLPEQAAVELFVSRAAAAGRVIAPDETVAAVCRRLDNLPLALELAAARVKLLSPAALLQRLDAALPLLTGGAHDLPDRQQTLRATIEWSHDLLDPDGQAAFRRLAVFRGSFTLESAEAITGADLDPIASLLDQSLLKPRRDDRFFLLETLREYAGERLDAAGETEEYARRHACWYLERLEEIERQPSQRTPELFAWFRLEEDNLRAMLDQLTAADVADAARAAVVLADHWVSRSAWSEARQRVDALLAHTGLPDQERAKLFLILARRADRLRDLDAAEAAARDALALASPGTFERARALMFLSWVAADRGNPEQAGRFADEALAESASIEPRPRAKIRHGIAQVLLQDAKRIEEARALLEEVRPELRRAGDELGALVAEINFGEIDLYARQYDRALAILLGALERSRQLGHIDLEAELLRESGLAFLGCGRRSDARATFAALLDLVEQNAPDAIPELTNALAGIALAAEPVEIHRAARLRGAVDNLRNTNNVTDFPATTSLEHDFEQRLIEALPEDGAWAREQAAGATLTLEATIDLARSLAATAPETTTTTPA
jgi:predicted ATPase/class 3 adenylate cyclase